MTINRVILSGRLGKEPILRSTANEGPMLVIRLASNYGETTEWHTLLAFGKTAEYIAKFAVKGQEIVADGRLSSRIYKDPTGQQREGSVVIISNVELGRAPQKLRPLGQPMQDERLSDTSPSESSTSMFEPT